MFVSVQTAASSGAKLLMSILQTEGGASGCVQPSEQEQLAEWERKASDAWFKQD